MDHAELEVQTRHVTIDQIVAMNIRYWRRAARMTQEELGELLGWSAANVSAAERSADDERDRRRFNAGTLTALSLALSVPLIALFLPPEDDGTVTRYLFRTPEGDGEMDMGDLMALVVMTDSDDDQPVMLAYRDRFRAAADMYLDEEWAKTVASWLKNIESAELRAIRADRLRSRQAEALRAAAEWGSLADAIDPGKEGATAPRERPSRTVRQEEPAVS